MDLVRIQPQPLIHIFNMKISTTVGIPLLLGRFGYNAHFIVTWGVEARLRINVMMLSVLKNVAIAKLLVTMDAWNFSVLKPRSSTCVHIIESWACLKHVTCWWLLLLMIKTVKRLNSTKLLPVWWFIYWALPCSTFDSVILLIDWFDCYLLDLNFIINPNV